MREIKFRAWHKNINYMCQSVKTDLLDRDYLEFMQYIGLKDINEKEIYEGDIVKTKYGMGIIKYSHKGVGFKIISYCGGSNEISNYIYDGGLEVVGNIYENEELLIK